MPSVVLQSTKNHLVDVRAVSAKGIIVFFFYPHTGNHGTPVPVGWNEIPGARGCTPQSCGYRDHYNELQAYSAEVYGISSQSLDEQVEFARRNELPYELLNDSEFRLTEAMRLPTFEFQSKRYIKRLALVVRNYRIEKVFYPVFPPDKNAEMVLQYLKDAKLGH